MVTFVETSSQDGNVLPRYLASRQTSMTRFFNSKVEAVEYVVALLPLVNDTQSITITKLDTSEVFCVSCVTSESSELEVQRSSSEQPSTSPTPQP